jgi:hypothetical protein
VFGDFDSLAWDLGNPDGSVLDIPGPFPLGLINLFTGQEMEKKFHPMKGPMTTQSLRGMANHGAMHWRGDRNGGNDAPTFQPDSGTFDERAAFEKFQDGFTDLLGRHAHIPPADMEAFTDFILQIVYPPNPIRSLDNSLTPEQQAGREEFLFGPAQDAIAPCGGCHTLDPEANPGVERPGFFGSGSFYTFDFEPQVFKVPHLRNAYQKIGMFGMQDLPLILNSFDNEFQGDQIRGVGFLHDGSLDTLFRFVNFTSFDPGLFPAANTPEGIESRRNLEAFMLAFDTNIAPIVGQQITLTHTNAAVVAPRIDLFIARAEAGDCELVAKGQLFFEELGFLYTGNDLFITSRQSFPPVHDALLRQFANLPGFELTYTCTPPGSGERIGVDRDGDGFYDGDELDAGSDPADPTSTP